MSKSSSQSPVKLSMSNLKAAANSDQPIPMPSSVNLTRKSTTSGHSKGAGVLTLHEQHKSKKTVQEHSADTESKTPKQKSQTGLPAAANKSAISDKAKHITGNVLKTEQTTFAPVPPTPQPQAETREPNQRTSVTVPETRSVKSLGMNTRGDGTQHWKYYVFMGIFLLVLSLLVVTLIVTRTKKLQNEEPVKTTTIRPVSIPGSVAIAFGSTTTATPK